MVRRNEDKTYKMKENTPEEQKLVDNYIRKLSGPVQVGWVCPVCGRGLSPYASVCPCGGYLARPFDMEITC